MLYCTCAISDVCKYITVISTQKNYEWGKEYMFLNLQKGLWSQYSIFHNFIHLDYPSQAFPSHIQESPNNSGHLHIEILESFNYFTGLLYILDPDNVPLALHCQK